MGIKQDKVATAQKKVDELKAIMNNNVKNMAQNVDDVEKNLLPSSQEIKGLAYKFKKDANELEEAA